MFMPSRLLVVTTTNIEQTDFWQEALGDGDPWVGYPFRWRVTCDVTPQQHSSPFTRQPYYYDGMDIRVGDWIADVATGRAVQVITIESQSPTSATVIVEDVDRYNTYSDPTGQGVGIGPLGTAFLFTLGDDGLPILSPMTVSATALQANLAWQLDQISRFRHRNMLRSYYRVNQPGHEFVVGDAIRLNNDGLYSKVDPTSGSVLGTVGTVNSVGVPGAAWFTYRPVGQVVTNIAPSLPGAPGDLIYLAADGSYTTARPTRWARPIYIRLETPDTGILIDRGVDTAGSLGYTTNVYVVPNDELSDLEGKVNPGDQVHVEDAGNGEWKHLIRHSDDTWHLLVTEDASDTDAETLSIEVDTASDEANPIGTVSAGGRVTSVVVRVLEPFDGNATLSVGTSTNPGELMGNEQVDLTVVGTYTTNPVCQFTTETDVLAFVDAAGSSGGRAKVTITYT